MVYRRQHKLKQNRRNYKVTQKKKLNGPKKAALVCIKRQRNLYLVSQERDSQTKRAKRIYQNTIRIKRVCKENVTSIDNRIDKITIK